jgi:hypothetical protein
LEYQILHNDFPAHRVSAIETLVHTVSGLSQLTSKRYLPENELGYAGDTAPLKQLAGLVARTWNRINFAESLSAIQQEVLMELLAQHGALLEKGWLLTPRGKLRIDFDPIQIKKTTEA